MMGRYCGYADTPRDLDPHYVYTFWANSLPLYVGCTVNLRSRMKDHQREPWMSRATWIAWAVLPNRAMGLDAEKDRIAKLMPRYNIRGNRGLERLVDAHAEYLAWREWEAEFEAETARERKREALRLLRRAAA